MFSGITKFFRRCNCFKPHQEESISSVTISKVSNKKSKSKNNSNSKSKKNRVEDENDGNDSNSSKERIDSNNIINDISYLDNINYKDTLAFIPPVKFGKVIKVYDGDTITIAARLPFEGSPIYRFSVRLAGIDSAEIRGGTKNETEIAKVARDALYKLIFGKVIELRNNGKEKYGRLLADLYLGELYINQWMIDNGYAVPYDGGKKNKSVEWE